MPQTPDRHPFMRAHPLMSTLSILAVLMLVVAIPVAAEAQPTAPPVQRVGDGDAISAAVATSQLAFPSGSTTVMVASAADFADALTGAPLAGVRRAPILYAERDRLPEATAQEVRRLGATDAVVLGGEVVLAPGVVDALRDLGVQRVQRIGGANRFGTAGQVADEVALATRTGSAYLALGSNPEPSRAWADAVAVSGLATRTGSPILLTAPDALPPETAQAIIDLDLARVTVIGGTSAITQTVEQQLRDLGVAVDRLAGSDRYRTSAAVMAAHRSVGAGLGELWIAPGSSFLEPLVAGPAAAALGGVMLLADGTGWMEQPLAEVLTANRGSIGVVRVVAGVDAFSDGVLGEMRALLSGEGTVAIAPGSDVTTIVANSPPGTTFTFLPGVHRGVNLTARTGDRFIGQPGAVLDGTTGLDMTDVAAVGGRWVASGLSSTLPAGSSYGCDSWLEGRGTIALCGSEQEVHRSEQLFIDGVRLRHVNGVSQVDRPGTWFYDHASGEVWLFDDPRAREVTWSRLPTAFSGFGADEVTIAGLTIRGYGSAVLTGAVDALDTDGWVIDDVEIVDNHGYGIRLGRNTTVRGSVIARNGQLGIGGSASDTAVTIAGNQILSNGQLGIQRNFEIGGVKVTHSLGAVIEDNLVADNAAKGIWLDGANRDAIIRNNRIERSGQTGILYEISYAAAIYGNLLVDNDTSEDRSESYGSIQIVNSRDVEVYDNTMRGGGAQELLIYADDIAPGVAGITIRDNDITVNTTWDEGTIGAKDLRSTRTVPLDVVFDGNTYRVQNSAVRPFAWDTRLITDAEWLAIHQRDRIIASP